MMWVIASFRDCPPVDRRPQIPAEAIKRYDRPELLDQAIQRLELRLAAERAHDRKAVRR